MSRAVTYATWALISQPSHNNTGEEGCPMRNTIVLLGETQVELPRETESSGCKCHDIHHNIQ